MSHQVITRMAYNAKTKQIETWQHSNNVWPTTDHFYALDVKTDEQMFEFITLTNIDSKRIVARAQMA